MRLQTARSVDPLRIEATLVIDDVDLELVFGALDAPVGLFYSIFSPLLHGKSPAQKLVLLAAVAERAETALRASSLNLTAGPPQPKE